MSKYESIYICKECGEEVEEIGFFKFRCPVCNKELDEFDVETAHVSKRSSFDDDIPEGCKACGGPYPHCKTSCSIFDD